MYFSVLHLTNAIRSKFLSGFSFLVNFSVTVPVFLTVQLLSSVCTKIEQFHCCCAPYCHVLDLMSHGTKYIVHQDETILAAVSLVLRYLCTTKNSVKKILMC